MFYSVAWVKAVVILAIVLIGQGYVSGADAVVGSVKTISGKPVLLRGSETIPITLGMHLVERDRLSTDAASRVGFILRDGSRVSLGPESEVVVEKFLFEPGKGELGLLMRLMRGVAAFVSGKIAQLSPESAVVETPVGIIGLRGTKFAAALAAN
ncbi:MAG: FecR domain-containing protein [Bryobacterales bacterium]|nr:FecR domain-containing protein [Bryobacterales bacterium]